MQKQFSVEMKNLKLFFVLLVFPLCVYSQQALEDIKRDNCISGSNYYAYPGPRADGLTPAPKGYKPVYISHYGRHGSRYLVSKDDYDVALRTLQHADSLGKLTAVGRETLAKVKMLREEAHNRFGELTQRGAEQHRDIARRMYERFPEVFKGDVHVDAKSTVVIRCILSMENALQELLRHNNKLRISHDASDHDMHYMNFWDAELMKRCLPERSKGDYDAFRSRHEKHDRVMRELFNDDSYWQNDINATDLNYRLFKLASNIQSSELRHKITLYNLFTAEELYENWLQTNAWWYAHYGGYTGNDANMSFIERRLLRKMIEEADSCLQEKRPGATLRYGHEVCVMPLACLMELDNWGLCTDDLEQLDKAGWRCYNLFPMACNVQMVFYRSKDKRKDTLVKVLLNENETRLPITPVTGNYYKWSDLRKYYLEKLRFFDIFQEETFQRSE